MMATVTSAEALVPDVRPPLIRQVNSSRCEQIEATQSDSDSLGSINSTGSYSTSLRSSINIYKFSNGRRYRETQWLLPNDEAEQDRMDLAHHVWRLILGGDLLKFGKNVEKWDRVLDVGTGTGKRQVHDTASQISFDILDRNMGH